MALRNCDERMYGAGWWTKEGMRVELPPSHASFPASCPGSIDPFITGGTTQLFPLGTTLIYGSRIFKYSKAGSVALATGKLMQSVVPLAGHIDEVCGGGAAGATTINFTPNTAVTDDLVAEKYRGHGVGKQLLTAVLNDAKALPDLKCILLTVATSQKAAR